MLDLYNLLGLNKSAAQTINNFKFINVNVNLIKGLLG